MEEKEDFNALPGNAADPETTDGTLSDEAEQQPVTETGLVSLRQLASEKEARHSNASLRSILGGDFLTTDWLRRQLGVIILIAIFTIIYISNRYSSQQELIEIDKLKKELQDIKYDALTRSSELLEKSRRSRIEEYLKETHDSTLQTATIPPFKLKITEEE